MPGRRSARRSGPDHGSIHGECRWCGAEIMWLRSTATNKLAPIDRVAQPGGNVIVNRTTKGAPTGTYTVVAGTERALFDPTTGSDDETPAMHMNHWATCKNATGRRLAKERAKSGKTHPTTVDGDPVSRALAPIPRCTVCGGDLDPAVAAGGQTTHPAC